MSGLGFLLLPVINKLMIFNVPILESSNYYYYNNHFTALSSKK